MLTPMRHALLARLLIKACDGLEESAGACRLEKSRLHECTVVAADPKKQAYLPVDVVADLEAYCGQPVYSRELVEARPASAAPASLTREICRMVESTTAAMAKIASAAEDQVITQAEQREIDKLLLACAEQLRVVTEANAKARARP